MEQQPNNPELTDGEISQLYLLLGNAVMRTDAQTEYKYIDVIGVEQDKDKSSPVALIRQLPLEEMTELLDIDPGLEKLKTAEITYQQEHRINNEVSEPVYSTVLIELNSEIQAQGAVINKNQWYVLTEPRTEPSLSRSYAGIEYTSKHLDDQAEINEELELIFDDMDELDRNLDQSDLETLLKIAKLLEN